MKQKTQLQAQRLKSRGAKVPVRASRASGGRRSSSNGRGGRRDTMHRSTAACRAIETESDRGRRGVAVLYGVNTLGAVTGCLLAAFLLIEAFGARYSLSSHRSAPGPIQSAGFISRTYTLFQNGGIPRS